MIWGSHASATFTYERLQHTIAVALPLRNKGKRQSGICIGWLMNTLQQRAQEGRLQQAGPNRSCLIGAVWTIAAEHNFVTRPCTPHRPIHLCQELPCTRSTR
jgi:hypothetical protein